VLLIEVTSPSTARLDRGEKRLNYLQIPSLLEYVLVAQEIPKVEIMRRSEAWVTRELFPGDALELDSVGLKLPLADIYQTITF
jgi:Uma2 family endonuclease